jgi:hypothetical protein
MDRFYKTQAKCHFYPMITKNTTTLMDSKDCMYLGGKATGKLYSTSGERLTNPEAYAHTYKPIYNNRRARGANLNARTGQFFINNTMPRFVNISKTAPERPCYMQKDSLDVLMTPSRDSNVNYRLK